MDKSNKETKKTAFQHGWLQVRLCDKKAVRSKVLEALGVGDFNDNWAFYKSGRREMKVSQAERVAAVFAEYGITDCWGAE